MKIIGAILSVVLGGFLVGLFLVQGAAATVTAGRSFPAAGMISYFGEIQSFLFRAGEPFKLMILGAILIVMAMRLHQTPEESPNG